MRCACGHVPREAGQGFELGDERRSPLGWHAAAFFARSAALSTAQSTSIALLMQLSAHLKHDVQAMALVTTGRLFLISMMSSGQTMAQTPVLSQTSVSIVTVMGDLRKAARPKPRALMEPIQAAV
jgi:hypothetical protein